MSKDKPKFDEKEEVKSSMAVFALVDEGNNLLLKGDIEQALNSFKQALEFHPTHPLILHAIGDTLSTQRKFEESITYYNEAIKFYRPNNIDNLSNAYFNQGHSLMELKLYNEAIQCYDWIIKNHSSHSRIYDPYYMRGSAHYLLGENEKAIECFDEVIKLKPDHVDAYNNMGNAKFALGKNEDALKNYESATKSYEEAGEYYDKAIEIRTDYAEAYFNKGNVFYALGDFHNAIKFYEEAIKYNKQYADAYNHKGLTYSDLGDYGNAIGCYNDAIKLKPDYAEAYNNKGVCLAAQSRHIEAIECFEPAISYNKKYAEAFGNKGNSLIELKKYDEAIKYLERAIELDSNNANTYNNLGVALSDSGAYSEAIKNYDKAIEINKDNALYYCNKGKALNDWGKEQEALESFNLAHELSQQGKFGEKLSRGNINAISQMLESRKILIEKLSQIQQDFSNVEEVIQEPEVKKILLRSKSLDGFQTLKESKNDLIKEIVQQLRDSGKFVTKEEHHKDITEVKQELKEEQDKKLAELEGNYNTKFSAYKKEVQEQIRLLIEEVKAQGSQLKTINVMLEVSGVIDKAEIKKSFDKLENDNPELYNYCRAFYWVLTGYMEAYRALSSGIVQGKVQGSKDSIIKSGIKKIAQYGKNIIGSIPIVGGVVDSLDDIIDSIYGFIKNKQFQRKVDAVTKIIESCFHMEDDISIHVAKTAIAATAMRENEIMAQAGDGGSQFNKILGAVKEKAKALQDKIFSDVLLHDSQGAILAIQDVAILLAYMYAHIQKGRCLYSLDKKEEASACFEQALTINPKDPSAYFRKVGMLYMLDKKEEAEKLLSDAPEIIENDYFGWFNKGWVLDVLLRKEEALEHLYKAITFKPDYQDSYIGAGNVLYDLRKYEEAIAHYDRALKLNHKSASAHYNKGKAFHALGKPEQAIACYKEAISLNLQFAEAWYNKGNVMLTLGYCDDAIFHCDQAIFINSTFAPAYYNKGRALSLLGKDAEAINEYDSAIKHNPKFVLYYCAKGQALNALGNEKESLKCFNIAYELVKANKAQVGNDLYDLSPLNAFYINSVLENDRKVLIEKLAQIQESYVDVQTRTKELDKQGLLKKEDSTKLEKLKNAKDDAINNAINYLNPEEKFKKYVDNKLAEQDSKHQAELKEQDEKHKKEIALLNNKLAEVQQQLENFHENLNNIKLTQNGFEEKFVKSGLDEQIAMDETLEQLSKDKPKQFDYCKAFIWTLTTYCEDYRSNSTTGIHATDTTETLKEKGVVRVGQQLVTKGAGYVPVVGQYAGKLDGVVDDIYQYKKKSNIKNKSAVITNIVFCSHNRPSDVETSIAKAALKIVKNGNKESEILNPPIDEHGMIKVATGWIDKKINSAVDWVLSNKIVEKTPQAKLAVEDVIILLTYLYENYETIIKTQKPFADLVVDIVVRDGSRLLQQTEQDESKDVPDGQDIGISEDGIVQPDVQANDLALLLPYPKHENHEQSEGVKALGTNYGLCNGWCEIL